MANARPESESLQDKVAIVTGGAGGIGLATARLLARDGATVVIGDLNREAGQAAEQAMLAAGFSACFIPTDVANEADVRGLVQSTVERFGGLHVMFNNAGIAGEEADVTNTSSETWTRIININLTGTFLSMKYGIAAMLESGGGSVINNASTAGLVGMPFNSAYSASKGGVVQLTKTAALEFAGKGVRVNCVCPAFIDTPLTTATTPADRMRGSFMKLLIPMGRLGKAEEVAELVLFLASDRASFMTGEIIPVDGGFVAR